ncbi:MAG: FAD-dependent oxidoreductase [Umezawaea sp.]
MLRFGNGPSTVIESAGHDIVVSGAGAAGLTATRILAERGVDVVCLEARGRTGGRLLSVPAEGGALDLGATWFWPGEQRVKRLVGEHGLAVFSQYLDGAGRYDGPDGVVRLNGNPIGVPAGRYGTGAASLTDALTAGLPAGTVRLNEAVAGIDQDGEELVVSTTGTRVPAARLAPGAPGARGALHGSQPHRRGAQP